MSWFSKSKSSINYLNGVNLSNLNVNKYLFLEYYKKNPIVYQCISLISSNISKFNIKNWHKNNWHNFIELISQNLMIYGVCYIHDYTVLDIFKLEIIYNNLKKKIYKYYNNNGYIIFENVLEIFLNNSCISPLEPCQIAIESYNLLSKYIMGIIKNGGKPSGILSFSEYSSSDHINNVKNSIEDIYQNMNEKGSVAILHGNYKWEPIGISPEKLQIIEMKREIVTEICSTFNIPKALINMENITFSNYKESRKQFNEDIIKPLLTKIINELNNFYNIKIQIEDNNEKI